MGTSVRLRVLIGVVALFAASFVARASAAPSGCQLTDQQFFADLGTIQDWNGIYDLFKRNLPACPDDGVYAEGYTDVIVHTLAKRWSYLPQLVTLIARDQAFHSFVVRHINASADVGELKQTRHNASTMCPPDAANLCKEVATRAGAALQHL